MKNRISVILLAGGKSTRIGGPIPKQFLPLSGKPVALHSFDLFNSLEEIDELVLVCSENYRHYFNRVSQKKIQFADPGERRQDSVYNALQKISLSNPLVCIHDAARPLIDTSLIERALIAAKEYGAAVVGMPIKFTVKEVDCHGFVFNTPDRSLLWEIQTPQVIRKDILEKAFAYAIEHDLSVTDDASLVELIQGKVKIVEGSHRNMKITVPEDLKVISHFV